MIKIGPSLLAADFMNLKQEVANVEKAGADYLHLDIMDGHFVPNISYGPGLVQSLRKHSNLMFDVHLMIERPEDFIQTFRDAGANLITVHAEATNHLHRLIQMIKGFDLMAGVALNPGTSPEELRYVIRDVDLVLVMSVNPGFGGQKFIPETLRKIQDMRKLIYATNSQALIQVDGGINEDTVGGAVSAGAEYLVAGSAIFRATNPQKAIQVMRDKASEACGDQEILEKN